MVLGWVGGRLLPGVRTYLLEHINGKRLLHLGFTNHPEKKRTGAQDGGGQREEKDERDTLEGGWRDWRTLKHNGGKEHIKTLTPLNSWLHFVDITPLMLGCCPRGHVEEQPGY